MTSKKSTDNVAAESARVAIIKTVRSHRIAAAVVSDLRRDDDDDDDDDYGSSSVVEHQLPPGLANRDIGRLPAVGDEYFKNQNIEDKGNDRQDSVLFLSKAGWEPILKTLLEGTRSGKHPNEEGNAAPLLPQEKAKNDDRDETKNETGDNNNLNGKRKDPPASESFSPLALLRNHEDTILRAILSFLENPYLRNVKLTIPAPLVGHGWFGTLRFSKGRMYPSWQSRDLLEDVSATTTCYKDGIVAFARVGRVTFPPSADRHVNMMPFILGDVTSLPEHLRDYYDLIEACPYSVDEIGKVAYLTIHESQEIAAGTTQRRGGLHIEAPGVCSCSSSSSSKFTPATEHSWGMGMVFGSDSFEGGIYMASSVKDTCQVWDALVDRSVPGMVDGHGGCEHLRNIIGRGTMLDAGELVWMTDCTPHEAMPQATSGPRQFFRVVGPNISHWYKNHSTANPKVPLPEHVEVVNGNKFQTNDSRDLTLTNAGGSITNKADGKANKKPRKMA